MHMTKVANAPLILPANFSVMAAQAQGLIPTNALVVTINGVAVSKGFACPTVTNLIGAGVLDPSLPASALGFAGGPQYGGD
jgi:hypothetical protein